jgi:hypothetical protein
MISSAAHPRWPPSITDKRLGRLISFLCGSLGVTRGRFLSTISSATHQRWPPSWIWFPSIRGQKPGSIDTIFSAAYWRWLEEGSFRWSAPPLIQDGRYMAAILDLVSIDILTNAWVDWSDFFGGSLGRITGGRFFSMTMQRRRSSNMSATAAILDLVSVDYLTNACVVWSDFMVTHWGSSIFTMFHFSLNLIFHSPTDNFPLGGICHALRCPCYYGQRYSILCWSTVIDKMFV